MRDRSRNFKTGPSSYVIVSLRIAWDNDYRATVVTDMCKVS
jgi:hypothetical protein